MKEFVESYDEDMENTTCAKPATCSVYDEHKECNRPGIISKDKACKGCGMMLRSRKREVRWKCSESYRLRLP